MPTMSHAAALATCCALALVSVAPLALALRSPGGGLDDAASNGSGSSATVGGPCAQSRRTYCNTTLPFGERVRLLVHSLTLSEKLNLTMSSHQVRERRRRCRTAPAALQLHSVVGWPRRACCAWSGRKVAAPAMARLHVLGGMERAGHTARGITRGAAPGLVPVAATAPCPSPPPHTSTRHRSPCDCHPSHCTSTLQLRRLRSPHGRYCSRTSHGRPPP